MTPLERHGGCWVKRDDTFEVNGVRGGKVRTCLAIASRPPRPPGLVTAGSRHSPQVHIVAAIGKYLDLPVRAHVPRGDDTPELTAAAALGADIVRHRPGYNSVIVARAAADAEASGRRLVPFGMECEEAVLQTASEVPEEWPEGVARVVVPVGSGMSLAGVYRGMWEKPRARRTLFGVVVGASPERRLDSYAPTWRWGFSDVTLVPSHMDYGERPKDTRLGDLDLDPVYEAKCLPYLKEGDLLWVVGRRSA